MTRDDSGTLERFIDSLGAACLVTCVDGVILAANRRAGSLYRTDRKELVGRQVIDLCAECDRGLVECSLGAINGTTQEFTARQRRDDGSDFLGEFTATKHHGSEREMLVLVVRELESRLMNLQENLELHHLMLEHAPDTIAAHTLDGELLYANEAALQMWGMTASEVRERGPWGWVATEMRRKVSHRVSLLLERGQVRFESQRLLPTGVVRLEEVHARLVHSSRGPIVVSTSRDITERMQAEEMVRYLAYHDMLTGLANRALLDQELAHEIAAADRLGDLIGVIFIDLDEFKPINDSYGHFIGDQVLREVADRIAGCVREYDTVARLGGDEFVVVLPRLPHREALVLVAHKLLEEISRPMAVCGGQLSVSASLGMALREPGEDAQTLLTRADLDMYEVRDQHRALRLVQGV